MIKLLIVGMFIVSIYGCAAPEKCKTEEECNKQKTIRIFERPDRFDRR